MPSANGSATQHQPSAIAVAAALGEVESLLAALLAEARSGALEIGVGDMQHRELVLEQFPVPGAKRALAYRTGNGFDALPVPTTGVLALPSNPSRLGCTFINSGANAIILYLANAQRPGVPAVWLAASGGSWDGRFGNLPWAGNVFAVAQTAASTLVGGEV